MCSFNIDTVSRSNREERGGRHEERDRDRDRDRERERDRDKDRERERDKERERDRDKDRDRERDRKHRREHREFLVLDCYCNILNVLYFPAVMVIQCGDIFIQVKKYINM